ncbi:MAG: acyl-CoA dehydrogenase [Acholeplasmataceae bacterium]|nr:acyl-CoA dehydrogenase [Acholeplasmataceae bacterium]
MDFELTEDQQSIQQLAKEFAEQKLASTIAERDEKHIFDRSLVNEMGDVGFNGICFPETYGGAGGDYLSYILAVEELSKVDDGMGITLSVNVSLCAGPIMAYGTEEQKQKYLRPIAEGKHVGAFGLTEPNAGTDAASQQTVATLEGDHYVLNGSKIFITNGNEADTYVVFAMTDRAKKFRGISAFILEKGMPGFSFGKKESKMGGHTSITTELVFHDVKVPKENLLGKEGEGFKIAISTLDAGRIGVAAQALGIAEAAMAHAIKYSKERVQFGKSISSFQVIGFKIADMAIKIDAARFLVYRAACLKNAGKPFSKEAAMAKAYASDVAMEVTTEAVQVYGGYGYTTDYPVERLMRNAKITQIYEGTNEVQRMVIAGELLKDKKKITIV